MMNDALFVDLVIANIFHFLPKKSLYDCCLVCHKWNGVSPKTLLRKFEWYQTNEIISGKQHSFVETKLFGSSFCPTLGCQLFLKNHDHTTLLIFTAYDKKSVFCLDLKVKLDKGSTVEYFKIPEFLSLDGNVHHYAIVREKIAVDFSDLNKPVIYDILMDEATKKFDSKKTFLKLISEIFKVFFTNSVLTLHHINKQLLINKLPSFPSKLFSGMNWKLSNNDIIIGSNSEHNEVAFVIFHQFNVKRAKIISLDSLGLSFEFMNNSHIFCNRYLMVLANPGFCIFDCFSDCDEPIIKESGKGPYLMAGQVNLTKNHFICYLRHKEYYEFVYMIFDMNKKTYRIIPNYYGNFLDDYRIEQVNDLCVHIHVFNQGKFTIDLDLMNLTSTDQKRRDPLQAPFLEFSYFSPFSLMSIHNDLEGRAIRASFSQLCGSPYG